MNYCKCGCGTRIAVDRRYVKGHNVMLLAEINKIRIRSSQERNNLSNAQRLRFRLCSVTDNTRLKQSIAAKKRIAHGHAWWLIPERRKIVGQKLSLYFKGRSKSESHIKAMSAACIGRKVSPRTRMKIAVGSSKRTKLNCKGRRLQAEKMRILWRDPLRKQQQSQVAVDVNRNRKLSLYLDCIGRTVWMKSGLEVKFAHWLNTQGIIWEYEPKTLLLSNSRRYTPDFWIPKYKTYCEVKGKYWPADKTFCAQKDGHRVALFYKIPTESLEKVLRHHYE